MYMDNLTETVQGIVDEITNGSWTNAGAMVLDEPLPFVVLTHVVCELHNIYTDVEDARRYSNILANIIEAQDDKTLVTMPLRKEGH